MTSFDPNHLPLAFHAGGKLLDYQTVMNETPEHVEPAYDGLSFEIDVPHAEF
ncbi:hypothetical protein [Aliirhizobium smilacinae]|uniref:hypothetical protein n=1 Tax=Aliirhizobium smilacinae TaxID=1395944 RepID=UPI00374276F5